jgi:hypothetical protein
MQQLEGRAGRFGDRRMVLSISCGYAVTKPGPNARAPGENGIPNRRSQTRRAPWNLRPSYRVAEGSLDPAADIHWQAPPGHAKCQFDLSFMSVNNY